MPGNVHRLHFVSWKEGAGQSMERAGSAALIRGASYESRLWLLQS